jgi:hypothetical protein
MSRWGLNGLPGGGAPPTAAVTAPRMRWPANRRRCALPLPPPHPPADISHTEAQLRTALRELDLLRHQEERQMGQRTAGLQSDYEAAMAALERRFLADAEALQASGAPDS